MISNATRALCAMLSTAAAAGLVMFANPANALGSSNHHPAAHVTVAAAPGAVARG